MDGPQPNAGILQLKPYQQGPSTIPTVTNPIKLSSNESALGPSPRAIEAYLGMQAELHRYPDGDQTELRAAIAEVHGLEPEQVICSNGSDELIGLLMRAYLTSGDELLMPENHFVMSAVHGIAVGADLVLAPDQDFGIDVDAMLERVGPKTRAVTIANPNNPTGTYLTDKQVRRLHAGLPKHVLLILDSAYAEFVDRDDYDAGVELVRESTNVVMTRSFSKAYGLAALRIGWGYCPGPIIDAVQRIRTPFNTNSAALAAAAAAVRDTDYLGQVRAHNSSSLAELIPAIGALGVHVVPSVANFYLIDFNGCAGKSAQAAAEHLQARGIIPRPAGGGALLRITVGTTDENAAVLAALGEYMT